MDGERTLEGGEEVTDADGPGSNSGRWGIGDGLQALLGTPMAAYSGCGERDGGIGHGKMRSRTGLARVGGDVGGTGGRAPSGWEWNGSQPGQGATELGFPRPALWQMQGEAACRAGEPSGQGEDPSSEGLGGHDLLTQTDAGCPASQVMRHHLNRQPGAVGGKTAGRHVVQPDAVLEVAYGVLDLGVAAVIGLQLQGFSVPVGDEAVIAVGGEEGQLGTGRRLHPPDDEPHRRGVRLTLEGGVELVSEVEAPHDNRSIREVTGRIIVVDSSLTQL